MKIKISTEKFNEINNIEIRDGYDATWCDWQNYDSNYLADISQYTNNDIEQSPSLRNVLNCAMNRANEQAVINAYEIEQINAYESYIERLENLLNDVVGNSCEHGKIQGKVSITLTQKPDCVGYGGVITIDGDSKSLALLTIEIINGEGMFRYDTLKEFATVINGKYLPSLAVENHLHYLLNVKLITDIWGEYYKTIEDLMDDRAISNSYPDNETIKDSIENELIENENNSDLQDELMAIKYAVKK